jgi:hypothetical protein
MYLRGFSAPVPLKTNLVFSVIFRASVRKASSRPKRLSPPLRYLKNGNVNGKR